ENEVNSFDCLQAIKENRKWDSTSIKEGHKNLHLRSFNEMKDAFQVWEEPLQTANEIAAKCEVTFSFDDIHLPKFPLSEGEKAQDYIKQLCENALLSKYQDSDYKDEAWQRLAYELQVINQLGFDDYFLIVADFVQYAKEKGI